MTAGFAVESAQVREPAAAAGQVRVERVMGTVIGIDVRSDIPAEALDRAFEYLHEVDARFSPFRPDSEFERLMTLPRCVDVPLKVALGGVQAPRERMVQAGWHVVDGPSASVTPSPSRASA